MTMAPPPDGFQTGPIWTPDPDRKAAAAGRDLSRPADLHRWSVADPGAFWSLVWDFCEVPGDKGAVAFQPGTHMTEARFFPEACLNLAEACLAGDAAAEVIVWRSEGAEERRLTRAALRDMVGRMQALLIAQGVEKGDRVAALMPNLPEAVALMLATSGLGAVWAACAPEFGAPAVLDRLAQAAPKVLFTVSRYAHAGKTQDMAEKVAAVVAGLPGALPLAPATQEPRFTPLPFDHPLCLVFSSGTTGKPKAILHRAGGVLLQHLKEHRLHCDIRPDDRVFQYSTLSWMMWNWQVSALASGACLLLWDGAAMYPSPTTLLDYAAAERVTHFGTSAGWIDALRKSGARPSETHDLGSLRCLTSTGSPLTVQNFHYIHEAVKPDLHLASISGGTDILSCFVLGLPTEPVFAGEIQGSGLGLVVDVVDATGAPAKRGDLVCRAPFPAMPLGFLNDPEGRRYRASYFDRFPGLWHHGDDAEWTATGGMVIHGRSDTVLNPGGVRIGTAEIYGPLARFAEIAEAACIGQDHEGDCRVVLFLRLAQGAELTGALQDRIRQTLRREASPRHVPARILAVPDLPGTLSGKISETAIAALINHRAIGNADALANPQSLTHFRDLPL